MNKPQYGLTPPTKRVALVDNVVAIGNYGVGKRFEFNDQPDLRTENGRIIVVKYLETYTNEVATITPTNQLPLPTLAQLKESWLVLTVRGVERLKYIPMLRLNRMYGIPTTGAPHAVEPLVVDDLIAVDWQKSYVLWTGGNVATAFSYAIQVGYNVHPDDYVNEF